VLSADAASEDGRVHEIEQFDGGDIKLNEANVLLVDDEPLLREIFGIWLGAENCRKFRTASNGKEALALIEEEPIDVLITDIRMPVMDGITLVRELSAAAGLVPSIILVSGFGDVNHREMYSLGVEAFLPKPIRREELIGTMARSVADRTALWQTPFSVEPRQQLQLEITDMEDTHFGPFRLGRGGFCVRHTKPMSLGKVAFRLSFLLEEREVTGHGYVRWYSQVEQTAGIEIVFLDENCRLWVSEKVRTSFPKSFIPQYSEGVLEDWDRAPASAKV
jgi:CheY-like chemotaxis protein